MSSSGSPNRFAVAERDALADLMVSVGPDHPTLCAGWSVRDLAAHLVVRMNRPDAAVGLVVPQASGRLASVQAEVSRRPWPELTAEVRRGMPWWSIVHVARVDAEVNTIEYFVHHEDVRRAAGSWEPRDLPADQVQDLWQRLTRGAVFLLRRCPVGVVAVPADGPQAGQERTLREGPTPVRLQGPVGELVLAVWGRATSGLSVTGDDAAIAAFTGFPR